jgi:hypothetical protein
LHFALTAFRTWKIIARRRLRPNCRLREGYQYEASTKLCLSTSSPRSPDSILYLLDCFKERNLNDDDGRCGDYCDDDIEDEFLPRSSEFVRVSHAANWIERSLCAISDFREDFSFCPQLVCPPDTRVLGYPWALLPNGTGSVYGIHGFDPVRIVQWPPPETVLWKNTTTSVMFTASDASGNTLECTWSVHVPPLVQVGRIEFGVHFDSVDSVIAPSDVGGSGRIFKMTGRLTESLRGAGASVRARLVKGSGKQTGSLNLNDTEKTGTIAFPWLDVQFSNFQVDDTELRIKTKRVTKATTVEYKLYGQLQL